MARSGELARDAAASGGRWLAGLLLGSAFGAVFETPLAIVLLAAPVAKHVPLAALAARGA